MTMVIIIANTVIGAVLCLGFLFIVSVLTWHAPMDTSMPASQSRFTKKEIDTLVDDIIDNERQILSYAHCRPYMLTGSEQCKSLFTEAWL